MYIILLEKDDYKLERTLFISGLNYNKYNLNKPIITSIFYNYMLEIITNNSNEINKIKNIINNHDSDNLIHDQLNYVHSLKELKNIYKKEDYTHNTYNSFYKRIFKNNII